MAFFRKFLRKQCNDKQEKWKGEYQALLEKYDFLEKKSKNEQNILIKAINNLYNAASGINPKWNSYLQGILNDSQKGLDVNLLEYDYEDSTNNLNQLKQQENVSRTRELIDSDSEVCTGFLQYFLTRFQSTQLQQCLNELKTHLYSFPEQQFLYYEIVNSLEEIANNLPSPVIKYQNNSTLIFETCDYGPSLLTIRAQFINLLEKIDIPDALNEKAHNLTQQLISSETTEIWEIMIDQLMDIVAELITYGQPKQPEIQMLLSQISANLNALVPELTITSNSVLDANQNRIKLNQSVSEQINVIQEYTQNATEIEPLKADISTFVTHTTNEIQEYMKKEKVVHEDYLNILETLTLKIKEMESETKELKFKLNVTSNVAKRDALTGLYNRLAYDERIKLETTAWKQSHKPFCLLIWDIDFFKKINDEYGHQTGDLTLIHVAKLLSQNIKIVDFIARYGGEEFVMLLFNTLGESALKMSNNLRVIVSQQPLKIINADLSITVSCGLTQFTESDTYTTAFARADQALYEAKNQGRNQCKLR